MRVASGSTASATTVAVDRDELAVAQRRRRRASPHHARHAQFARHDRRVAGHATSVGHHRRRAADGRHPIRVGHRGDEHLACLEPAPFLRRQQHPHSAGGDARGGGQAPQQQLARFRTGVGWGRGRSAEGGDRAGLQQPGPVARDGPLDVLGLAVVVGLHPHAEAGQFDDLLVAQHSSTRLDDVEIDARHGAVGSGHQLVRLVADPHLPQTGALLGQHVGVRLHLAGHHHLTQPERGFDDDPAAITGRGIGGEQHAGALGLDQALHDHGDGGLFGQALAGPVGDDPLAEQRRPAVDEALRHGRVSHDVGERPVHPRERRARRVLGGGRGAHRHGHVGAEPVVGGQDLGLHHGGHARLADQRPQPLGQVRQRGGVVGPSPRFIEGHPQLVADAALLHGRQVARRRHHEARRHRQAGTDQLTQVGTLATGRDRVGRAEVLEPDDDARHQALAAVIACGLAANSWNAPQARGA